MGDTSDQSDGIVTETTDAGTRYEEYIERKNAHPGSVAYNRWREMGRSFDIFVRNSIDLLRLLTEFRHNGDLMVEVVLNQDPDSSAKRDFFGQLDQRVHNFAAARASLVDHARRHMKPYTGSSFSKEYTKRTNALAVLPCAVFVHDFRNFLLHYGVAPFVMRISVDDSLESETGSTLLACAGLLPYKDWKPLSKQYIADCQPEIDLLDTVTEVFRAFDGLYGWMFSQFESLHGPEVDEINEMTREANLMLSGGRFADPREHFEQIRNQLQEMNDQASESGVGQ